MADFGNLPDRHRVLAASVAYAARRMWRLPRLSTEEEVILDLLVEALWRMGKQFRKPAAKHANVALASSPAHVRKLVALLQPVAQPPPAAVVAPVVVVEQEQLDSEQGQFSPGSTTMPMVAGASPSPQHAAGTDEVDDYQQTVENANDERPWTSSSTRRTTRTRGTRLRQNRELHQAQARRQAWCLRAEQRAADDEHRPQRSPPVQPYMGLSWDNRVTIRGVVPDGDGAEGVDGNRDEHPLQRSVHALSADGDRAEGVDGNRAGHAEQRGEEEDDLEGDGLDAVPVLQGGSFAGVHVDGVEFVRWADRASVTSGDLVLAPDGRGHLSMLVD